MKRTMLILITVLFAALAYAGPPGQTLPVTAADVCRAGYAQEVRNVSAATKSVVYQRAGMKQGQGVCSAGCVIDHAVSLSLGGSNDIRNLQVQTRADSAAKDRVENNLHREVCAGRVTLEDAQWLVRNWRYVRVP